MSSQRSVGAKVSFFASEAGGRRGYRLEVEGVMGVTFQRMTNKFACYVDGEYQVLGEYEEYSGYEGWTNDELQERAQPLMEEHLRTRFPSLELVRFNFTWR